MPALHIVSYGSETPQHERSLAQLRASSARVLPDARHFFYTEASFSRHLQTLYGTSFLEARRSLRDWVGRPYCAGFKPILMAHALQQVPEGDLVAWVDASRYDVAVHVSWSARALTNHPMFTKGRARGYFGALHCMPRVKNIHIVTPPQFNHFNLSGKLDDRIATLPHVLDTILILRNDALNRIIVSRWLDVYMRYPKVFCETDFPPQSIWSLLVGLYDLPVVDFCTCLPPRPKAHQLWKSAVNLFCLLRNHTYRRARISLFAAEDEAQNQQSQSFSGQAKFHIPCENRWLGSWRSPHASPMAELWSQENVGRGGPPVRSIRFPGDFLRSHKLNVRNQTPTCSKCKNDMCETFYPLS